MSNTHSHPMALAGRTPTNRRLNKLARVLARAAKMADAHLKQHPTACDCTFCLGIGHRYTRGLLRDLQGARWACEMAGDMIGSVIVPDGVAKALGADDTHDAGGRANAGADQSVILRREGESS